MWLERPASNSPLLINRFPRILAIGNKQFYSVFPSWCREMGCQQSQQKSSFVLQLSSWSGCRADQHIAVSEYSLVNILVLLSPPSIKTGLQLPPPPDIFLNTKRIKKVFFLCLLASKQFKKFSRTPLTLNMTPIEDAPCTLHTSTQDLKDGT